MPELAEKTPIYDVFVYMNGNKDALKIGEGLIYDQADAMVDKFDWNWPGKYGARATTRVGDRRFVLNNVDYVEIRRSKRRVETESIPGRITWPVYEDAFLEDEDDNA